MLLKSIKIKQVFPGYDTDSVNLEKCQVECWTKHLGVEKEEDIRVRRQNSSSVCKVQYQLHLKDVVAGYTVVKAHKVQANMD